MDERDISKLERYIDTYLFIPSIGWFRDAYYVQVYSRWAAYEILERMMDEAMKLPEHISGIERRSALEIVDEFTDEMGYYYEASDDPHKKFIFYVAMNAAMSISILFERSKGEN